MPGCLLQLREIIHQSETLHYFGLFAKGKSITEPYYRAFKNYVNFFVIGQGPCRKNEPPMISYKFRFSSNGIRFINKPAKLCSICAPKKGLSVL